MSAHRFRPPQDKRQLVLDAVERRTRELGRLPAPHEVEEIAGLPHGTLHRYFNILEKEGSLRRIPRVQGGYVGLEVMRPRGSTVELGTNERAILVAVAALQMVDGERVPVPLEDIIARILEAERLILTHAVEALVQAGLLIAEDGGYLLPEE